MIYDYDNQKSSDNHTKIILFWENSFWFLGNEKAREKYLKGVKCPNINCILTNSKKFLQNSHDYDAIVFCGHDSKLTSILPKTRSPRQFYVMASME